MTGPNVDEIMRRKVSGDSPSHVLWSTAKKNAARGGADLSKLPKEDLGPLFDNYRQYLRGAGELSRLFPEWKTKGWDPKALKPLKETRKKIEAAITKYKQVCAQQATAQGTSPAVKKAWLDLDAALGVADQSLENTLNAFNRLQEKDGLLKLKWDALR
jgi:uncharacterized protein (UPF0335 family)